MHANFIFFERLKSVRNDLILSLHSMMVNLKEKSESLIKYYTKLRVPLSEPVSDHVKQYLTRVLSAFHTTPVSVTITDW